MKNKDYVLEEKELTNPEMFKVYFIHENTKGVKVGNKYTQIPTDYVVTIGYKTKNDDTIYNSEDRDFELHNRVPGVWWDTYDDGAKALTKLMKDMMIYYSDDIKKTFDKLKEKYPEMLV